MAKVKIGEIKKLVCVGGGLVAAVGEKGTFRFEWASAYSRGRVDELGDVRLDMALRHGYAGHDCEKLASALPRGAVIPLPSAKRANNWLKQNRGPKSGSRWPYESALEAGFRPRYYLGEKEQPNFMISQEAWYWGIERAYMSNWVNVAIEYWLFGKDLPEAERAFLKKVPDWQTRALVAAMAEDEFCNGEWERFSMYMLTDPLL